MPRRYTAHAAGSGPGELDGAGLGDISAMTVVVLRARLKELGQSSAGNKAQLVERLRDSLSDNQRETSTASVSVAAKIEGGLLSLLAMGFSREAASAALAAVGGDAAAAAEALADASVTEERPRKRGKQISSEPSASFASSSTGSLDRSLGAAITRTTSYRRPTAGTEDRIERALSQRLYLLDRQDDASNRETPQATFMVLGSTGNVYEVQISGRPCCDCPDFVRRQSPCKHVLFVWLRVLRLDDGDPRVWQKRLSAGDVRNVLQRRRAPTVARGVRAPQDVKQRYDQAMGCGSCGSVDTEPPPQSGRLRKPLDDDDCPICYEAMADHEEKNGLVTFCSCCGSNLHKDCMARWQRASKKADCPFCREPYRPPSTHVAPGVAMPVASKPAGGGLSKRSSGSNGYLNLLGVDEDEDW